MSLPPRSAQDNLLLRRLLPEDFALLAPHLEPITEKLGAILCRPGTPAGHAIFPGNGILSMVAQSPEGQRGEAGLLGREGFGPTSLALGDDQSLRNRAGLEVFAGDAYGKAEAEYERLLGPMR